MAKSRGIPGLVDRAQSGVVQIIWAAGNSTLAGGTGFFIRGHLVTNYHVAILRPARCDRCLIRFFDDPPNRARHTFTPAEIDASITGSAEPDGFDYAVLNLPQLNGAQHFEFEFGPRDRPLVGEHVALLGYPLGLPYLSCHAGIVSSIHPSGVASVIQIDASVNSGNSGGPLVDPVSGRVLGIVTRRETGLTRAFNELRQSFDNNIRVLRGVTASMAVGGVDPIKVLIASQEQMKRITVELEHSANVGIGYAIKCDALMDEPSLAS